MKTKSPKYRLLVLTDLTKSSEIALRNAVQLAKVIHGEVSVFHAKAPADVVRRANQLSAMRTIHEDYNATKAALDNLVRSLEQEEGISIRQNISYGNIKNTIKEHIAKMQPDVVVLGKRKPKFLNLKGSGIADFVLKTCKVNILIAGDDQKLHSFNDLSLGVYGDALEDRGFEIIQDLSKTGSKPIKFFNVGERSNPVAERTPKETVSYIFSEGANAFDGLASYVLKTNTQLLCIAGNSGDSNSGTRRWNSQAPVRQVVHKLDIPVLIMA